ncbi:hypothetical protein NEF87_002217 [Candidatus Lokiarchaeum ossiferum]|uniref:LamG domain-containing protein n=1 Tax=Candidatus Lokiarchaeum ossiferum TaxID=2951803 RepID=A0ABY6HQZ6_9ARCH|nr:hypothetical protein NEF87_002217 [Candidatus Lokiarchaeum sp. B-35]
MSIQLDEIMKKKPGIIRFVNAILGVGVAGICINWISEYQNTFCYIIIGTIAFACIVIKVIFEFKKRHPKIPQRFPLLHLPFDEGYGDIVSDKSSNNYTGIINGAQWERDNMGFSLKFDGVDDFIDIERFRFQDQCFSISLWVKPGENQVSCACLLDYSHHKNQSNWALQQYHDNQNIFNFPFMSNGWKEGGLSVYVNLTAQEWQLLTITFNLGEIKNYINANLVNSGNLGGKIQYNSISTLRIGGVIDLKRYFNGSLADIRIYNTILNQIEIEKLYAKKRKEQKRLSKIEQKRQLNIGKKKKTENQRK